MKTPCQEAPELWVSEFVDARREAAIGCNTGGPDGARCPAFDWCAKQVEWIKPTHGVFAGRDYSKVDALTNPQPRAKRRAKGEPAPTKECSECGDTYARSYHSAKQWGRSRFCGLSCANTASGRKEKAA